MSSLVYTQNTASIVCTQCVDLDASPVDFICNLTIPYSLDALIRGVKNQEVSLGLQA